MMVGSLSAVTGNGFVRVGFAVEDQNAAIVRQAGCFYQVEWEGRSAIPFIAFDPALRPPSHILCRVGHKGLLGVELAAVFRTVLFAEKCLVNIVGGLPGIEAKDRGVSHVRAPTQQFFAPIHPVVDDAKVARLKIKEIVQRPSNHNIEIKKERRPLKIAKALLSKHEFNQHVRPAARQPRIFWKGNYANILVQVRRILGAAKKVKGLVQMTTNTRIQTVNVVRRVARAVFQADDVDGGLVH